MIHVIVTLMRVVVQRGWGLCRFLSRREQNYLEINVKKKKNKDTTYSTRPGCGLTGFADRILIQLIKNLNRSKLNKKLVKMLIWSESVKNLGWLAPWWTWGKTQSKLDAQLIDFVLKKYLGLKWYCFYL